MRVFSTQKFFTWYDRESSDVKGAVERCLAEIQQVIQRYGPYDGIYGFSLGAMLATCLCSARTWRLVQGENRPKFVILACAGMGDSVAMAQLESFFCFAVVLVLFWLKNTTIFACFSLTKVGLCRWI